MQSKQKPVINNLIWGKLVSDSWRLRYNTLAMQTILLNYTHLYIDLAQKINFFSSVTHLLAPTIENC